MKILITGSGGMLGRAIQRELARANIHELWGIDLKREADEILRRDAFIRCDITDYKKIDKAIKSVRPDMVIHTAAYTDVDGCETDPDKAESANALGTKYVAQAALDCGASILYISTDFVFDGEKKIPYTENDRPNPINIYGRSKLNGEKFVADIMEKKGYFIVRTSWMFGSGSRNFVDTILRKAEAGERLKVVTDQFGSPTYADDLAGAIAKMLAAYGLRDDIYGIYHVTNSDDCSWFRLAQRALEHSGMYDVQLIPITSDELDRPAQRPSMSILDNSRYINLFGEKLRRWDDALAEYIRIRRKGR